MSSSAVRVLLVEDEEHYVRLLRRWLAADEPCRFEVECAGSLREALERVHRDGYDVVVLDLGLPDARGIETVERFFADSPGLPVIILSGETDDGVVFQALARGARDYLIKGAPVRDLLPRAIIYAVEQQRIEMSLREQLSFMETLLDTIPNPVFYKDPQGRYLGCNAAFEELVGLTREEIVGARDHDLAPPHVADQYLAQDLQLLQCLGKQHYEWRVRRGDGEMRDVISDKATFRDSRGEVAGLIGVISDISARKRAEEDAQRFSRKLLSVREEEKRKLSGVLHHEVGSVAVGLSSRLGALHELINARRWEDAMGAARESQQMLGEFVGRLKEIAVDLRPPDLDIVGLPLALKDYLRQLTKRTSVRIDFMTTLDEAQISEPGAITLFRTAQESLTNAIKHAGADRVTVRLWPHRHGVSLSVRDDGRGFDVAKRFGDPGEHLGLRAMREMAVSQGGTFEVRSAPGEGTLVTVTLPGASPGVAVPSLAAGAPVCPAGEDGTVS